MDRYLYNQSLDNQEPLDLSVRNNGNLRNNYQSVPTRQNDSALNRGRPPMQDSPLDLTVKKRKRTRSVEPSRAPPGVQPVSFVHSFYCKKLCT